LLFPIHYVNTLCVCRTGSANLTIKTVRKISCLFVCMHVVEIMSQKLQHRQPHA